MKKLCRKQRIVKMLIRNNLMVDVLYKIFTFDSEFILSVEPMAFQNKII